MSLFSTNTAISETSVVYSGCTSVPKISNYFLGTHDGYVHE